MVPLRQTKRSIFLGRRASARATRRSARAMCKGHKKRCKGLRIFQNFKRQKMRPLHTSEALASNQYFGIKTKYVALAHIRGPCTSSCGPCTYPSGPCTHFYLMELWPLHMALAPLLVALALALAPGKMLLFGRHFFNSKFFVGIRKKSNNEFSRKKQTNGFQIL